MAKVEKRNPLVVVVLSLVTLGLYGLYWIYKTKEEINSLGGTIPSFILAIIPLVNIYFMWRYCEEFTKHVKKDESPILYFLLWIVIFPVAQYLIQSELNKLAK